jgi:hypothetical protein
MTFDPSNGTATAPPFKPVIPPGNLDRPTTRFRRALLRLGYAPIPVNGKIPNFDEWQKTVPTEPLILRWDSLLPDHSNTSILTQKNPATDIDIYLASLAEEIHKLALEMLCGNGSPAPLIRVGMEPKRALIFRADVPFRKISTKVYIDLEGRKNKVEILADGQQVVVKGIHPDTGRNYYYPKESITQRPSATLPLLTAELAREFIAKCEELLKQTGWPTETELAQRNREGRVTAGLNDKEPATLEQVEEALEYIYSDGYDDWVRVGLALYHEFADAGRPLWECWSAKSSKYNPKIMDAKWRSFSDVHSIGIGSVFWMGQQNGWRRKPDEEPNRSKAKSEEWPEPKPLPDGLLAVDAFDMEFLPDSIGPWVMDISDRMQCPPEYVAVPATVALGSVIGRKVGIKPRQKDDWVEVANLWGALVGRPGTLKSPAMQEALKPIRRLEVDAGKLNEASLKDYEDKLASFKNKKDVAAECERNRLRGKKDVPNVEVGDAPKEPELLRYVTNDTTYEKLGEILVANPRGILVVRDELVSLLQTLDREDQAGARGFYLSGWNGTQPYTFDRIIRGHIGLPAVCISLLGTTQPGRIAEYIHGVHAGGERDDGLVQRFGLLIWPDEPATWKDIDEWPDTEKRQTAWRTFTRLNDLTPAGCEAECGDFDKVPFLRFDDEGREHFRGWHSNLKRQIRSGELSSALEGHLAKYPKVAATLALINHLADGGSGPIGEKATLKALAFIAFLESHARRIYRSGLEIEAAAATAILKRIRGGDLRDGFSARDVHQHQWSKLADVEHVRVGLSLLCDFHHLAAVQVPPGPAGGRPTVVYHVNPRTLR